MSRLGEALREARESRALGQIELAGRLGVTQQTVSRWESGVGLPRPSRLAQLAGELGLDGRRLQQLAGYLPVDPSPLHVSVDVGALDDHQLVDLLYRVSRELRDRQARADEREEEVLEQEA